MKRRYKIILNLEITDPEKPFPAGGDYTHLSLIEGIVHRIVNTWIDADMKMTLDKVIDKGIVGAQTQETSIEPTAEMRKKEE